MQSEIKALNDKVFGVPEEENKKKTTKATPNANTKELAKKSVNKEKQRRKSRANGGSENKIK